MSNAEKEALRRIHEAGALIASAIRLGGNPLDVASVVRAAVARGAEQYAEAMQDDYRRES